MKVIIVGCGRMGRGLAEVLVKRGDEVTIIDQNQAALDELRNEFSGKTIRGIGFDRGILEKANIQLTDAIVSCTNSDETNALVARIARLIYRVPRAVARLYDAHKADIYNALGIQVISTTVWGIRYAIDLLSYDRLEVVEDFGSGRVKMIRVEVPPLLAGRRVLDISRMGETQVSCLTRQNRTFIPTDGTILEEGDVLFMAVDNGFMPSIKSMLGLQ